MKIDIHCHYAPKEYLDMLTERGDYPHVRIRDGQYFLAHDQATGYMVGPEIYDIETKLSAMCAAGVDMQALSIIVPGCDKVERELSLRLARTANDHLAQVQQQYPGKFVGLATIPMEHPSLALKEMDRAIKELDLRGIQIYSNVAGRPLDEPDFWPIYKRAAELDIPIMIHPAMPAFADYVRKFALVYVLGFIFDTTLAMTRLIISGVLQEYPDVKFILCHMGSTIPYLLARIDCESARVPGGLGNLSKLPSEYFSKVYMDTVTLHQPALKCGYEVSGPDKILFGTDYPYWKMEDAVATLDAWPLSETDRRKISNDNAKRLLRIS